MGELRLRNTIKYPTSLIINGASALGLEIAESLLEQGGYVILVDGYTQSNIDQIVQRFGNTALVSLLDYAAIPHLEEDVRRLDYVFYLAHDSLSDKDLEVSTQDFLRYSNYLDSTLALAGKFEAKFLLTTSIKAHQLLMANSEIDFNYGKNAKKHTVYTDTEVQRYGESLTLEYASKANLSARIVRLGELIGNGLDMSRQTTFVELIMAAVSGQSLELANDGLEAEWYVHILDAAYGIIKAQFTRNTTGEIYSLAYEQPYTHLSLAYKIQELEPEAKEIGFKEDDRLPPLKLHKPAQNLTAIGWKPKVEIEQAINESLATAKLYVINNPEVLPAGADASVADKLKSFLNIAKQPSDNASIEDQSGPISRLIAERKRQGQAREIGLAEADDTMKRARKQRNLSIFDRFRGWIWSNFFSASTSFPMLRKITPIQFVVYVILISGLIYLYFTVFAPLVIVGRNLLLARSQLSQLETAVVQRDMSSVATYSKQLYESFNQTATILRGYQSAAKLIAADGYLSPLINAAQNYGSFTEGVYKLSYSLTPLNDYMDGYVDNLKYRSSSDSYLSAGVSTDYSPILNELLDREPFVDVGVDQIVKAKLDRINVDVSFLPAALQTEVEGFEQRLYNLAAIEQLAPIAKYGSELLGVKAPKTYLWLIVDNSKPTPIGGQLSAYVTATVQNGAIADVQVRSIDVFNTDLPANVPAYALSAINAHSFTDKSASALKVGDLAMIGDPAIFSDTAKILWGKALGRDVDGVFVVNYEFLDKLIELAGGVEIEKVRFTGNNLLDALSELQVENQTVNRRNDVVAQATAYSLDQLFDHYNANLYPLTSLLADSTANKNLVAPENDLDFNAVLKSMGATGDLIANADLPIYTYFTADGQDVSPKRYPAFNRSTKITVRDDSSMFVEMALKFPAVSNAGEMAVCLPLAAKAPVVTGIGADRIRTKRFNNQTCIITDIVSESEIGVSFETLLFESPTDSEYNLSVGFNKVNGMESVSNVEITLASSLNFDKIAPTVASVGGKATFTDNLQSDQLIEFAVKK